MPLRRVSKSAMSLSALRLSALRARAWPLQALALLLAALLTLLGSQLFGARLALWDEQAASLAWRLADRQQTERRFVIIDIDEKSVQTHGAWPWSRALQAELLERLDAAGIGLKMLDILHEGPQDEAADARLAAALSQAAPGVVAQLFILDPPPGSAIPRSGQLGGALPLGTPCPQASTPARGYMANSLGLGSNPAGHITPLIDPDGSIRRLPALICYDQQTYASLTIAGFIAASGVSPRLTHDNGLLAPAWWLDLGAVRLPLDEQGRLRVSYRLPRDGYVSISAADVLDGTAPPELLKGTWALIGATAFGARDVVTTPLERAASGVEVHAQVLSALLDGRTPYQPQGAWLWPWLAGFIAVVVLWLTQRRWPAAPHLALPLAALGLLAGLYVATTALLLQADLHLGWSTPALFIGLAASLLGVAAYARMRQERERLYRNLASYLPEPVARRIASEEPGTQVNAQRVEASVLYADLRNFSAWCEGRPPEETAMVLHLFFTTASRIVEEHGGVVEQMVGDSLLAVWNGSAPCEDHARQALAAARVLWHRCVAQLPRLDAPDLPQLDLGIGLETGSLLIGSCGPAARRTHTVLGEPLTVATRLQAMTAELAYPILLGPRLAHICSQYDDQAPLLRLGEFLLAGLSRPRLLYALPITLDPLQGQLRLISGGKDGASVERRARA